MRKFLLLIIILTTIISCNQNTKYNKENFIKLEDENRKLKEELKNLKVKSETSKFLWTVIYCKTGTNSFDPATGKESWIGKLEDKIYSSDIIELNNVTESTKYKLQDELENKVRNQLRSALHSVQNRKTFVFDSYEEASKFKFKALN